MSNYTKSTNFATKDNLTPGDPLKVVRGTEIDTEFNNIATAVATKTDNASAAITGGTIDGATVGATTPATGAFTTLAASGTTTLAGALVGAATQSAFNTVSTTLNLGGAATALNLGAATGTATVNNTTLAAKAITASTTLAVTGTSTLTGAVTATAGVSGPITSSSVSITGGSITGITDLAVADGGTGASTAAGGLNNLLPTQTGNANKYLQTDGTNATWDAVTLSTADITGTLPVANGGTGVTSSTGTGNVVLSNSPTLVTPALGTPSAAVLTNATGLPISTGVSGLGTGVATLLATPSSANLASAITDETGSGALVFATSPTLVTPILGTPTSATLTNATGLPIATGVSGLGTGVATFLATPSSANLRSALTDETGTGSAVFATSPTLVTPVLGTPTSATLTNATGLPLTTGVTGTLPTANGGTNLTSFTSGGVVYASSSSALATGSALTFDGTTLGVNNGVAGGTAVSLTGTYSGSGTVNFLTFQRVGGAVAGALRYSDDNPFGMMFGTTTSHAQIFMTANTERMRISNAGDVGIGTSSPAYKLSVVKPSAGITARFTDGDGIADIYGYGLEVTRSVAYIKGSNALHLGSAAGYSMVVLDSAGNLGVGTTSPQQNLDIRGSTTVGTKIFGVGTNANAVTLLVNSAGNQSGSYNADTASVQGVLCIGAYTSGATATSLVARGSAIIAETIGNLLVGTTSVVNLSKFCLVGDFYNYNGASIQTTNGGSGSQFMAFINESGTVIGTINRVSTTNAVVYNTTSDYRLKTVVGTVTGQGARLDALKPIDYLWAEGNQQARGFLAHEFQTVYPNSVTGEKDAVDADGNPKYQQMQAATSEVIADLVAEIQSLRQRLSAANL